MNIPGRVQNGVVVLEGDRTLPEGTRVTVVCSDDPEKPVSDEPQTDRRRVELPLVRNGAPGSIPLTAERIAEILDEDDAASGR